MLNASSNNLLAPLYTISETCCILFLLMKYILFTSQSLVFFSVQTACISHEICIFVTQLLVTAELFIII